MTRSIVMPLKKINSYIFFLFSLFLAGSLSGADLSTDPLKIIAFADHLFKTEDYMRAAIEYERYLFLSNSTDDSVLFKIGLCHQFRKRHDFAVRSFREITRKNSSHIMKSARLAILYNLYLMQDWNGILDFGYRNDDEYYFFYLAGLNRDSTVIDQENISQLSDDSLRSVLVRIDEKYKQLKPKSPLLASVLSAAIPGLGKLYIKRPGDALFACGMTSFAGIVAWRAFEAQLLITGIVTSGITFSFYLGTVYGSYIGTQLYNENLNDELIRELERYNPVTKNPYWLPWLKK